MAIVSPVAAAIRTLSINGLDLLDQTRDFSQRDTDALSETSAASVLNTNNPRAVNDPDGVSPPFELNTLNGIDNDNPLLVANENDRFERQIEVAREEQRFNFDIALPPEAELALLQQQEVRNEQPFANDNQFSFDFESGDVNLTQREQTARENLELADVFDVALLYQRNTFLNGLAGSLAVTVRREQSTDLIA